MAKLERQAQTAQCVKVRQLHISEQKDGAKVKDIYVMSLDGNPDPEKYFEVFKSEYFEAKVGDVFTPLIVVRMVAYMGKNGKAYNRVQCMINWEKVGG